MIEPVVIREAIENYLKNHPRLQSNGEIEYKGKTVEAMEVKKFEGFPFSEWLVGMVPSLHVYYDTETLGRFSTQRRQTGLDLYVSAVTACSTRQKSMDKTAALAKIVQRCLEEESCPYRPEVVRIKYDAARTDDRFLIVGDVSIKILYFETRDK